MMKRVLALLTVLVLLTVCSAAVAADQTGNGLPSRYDMREDGIVTPVKLQYPWGTCWTFGTLAAAETSILSAMGVTYEEYPLDLSELHTAWFAKHPITEADDPAQANEGILRDDGESPTKEQYNLSSGASYMVGALLATGAGPVEESAVPYHGREKTPEAYVALQEPEKWIDNYMEMHADLMESFQIPEELRESLPPELLFDDVEGMTEEELRAEAEKELKKKQAEVATGYYLQWYSGDDWSLPETDENGKSFRMQRSKWLLTDENRLPAPLVATDPEDRNSPRVLNEAGMTAMKQEMLNGHAVAAGYYAESYSPIGENPTDFMNYETWAQYTYEPISNSHIICLVGWDDDYPAENFTHEVYTTDENGNRVVDPERTAKTTPPGNGAWLMKNSRGSETDAIPDGMTAPDGTVYPEHRSDYGIVDADGLHTGYNWISYYDQQLSQPETLAFIVEEEPSGILQYDYLIESPAALYEKQSEQPLSAANVFTADRDMTLTAVSAETFYENSRVVFTVVKLNGNAETPEDGEVVAKFSENFMYKGFHRAELPKSVSLKKGDRFSVITEISHLSEDGKRVWMVAAARGETLMECIIVNPGESFVKENGKWQDWTEAKKDLPLDGDSAEEDLWDYDNFGIKAFFRENF